MGMISSFVDEGPPMRALLERFRRTPSEIATGHATYIGTVLSAFDEADNTASSSSSYADTKITPGTLSARELEILGYVARGLSNKEVGRSLNLAPETVKWHMGVTIGAVIGAVIGVAIFAVFSAPLLVSLIAAGVGAYVGSLVGAMSRTKERGKSDYRVPYHEEARDSGVLVAVHVSPDNQLDAARVLREAGGVSIEKATGRWQQGRWADFDPLKTPEPIKEFAEKRA